MAVKIFFFEKIPDEVFTSKMRGIGKVMAKLPVYMNDSSSESSCHSDNDDDDDNEDVVVDVVPPSPMMVGDEEEEKEKKKKASKRGEARMKKYQKALKEFASRYASLRDDEEKSAYTLEFATEYPLGKSRSRKAGKGKKKRLSAFNVFFSRKLKELKETGRGGVNNTERLTMVGQLWNEMSADEKAEYTRMADAKNLENDPTYDANAVKKVVKEKTPEQLFLRWLKDRMVGMPEYAGLSGKELHKAAVKEGKKDEYTARKREFYHNY